MHPEKCGCRSSPMPAESRVRAILLAGGKGTRLGGVQKALLSRGQVTQLRRWLAELEDRGIPAVVVGPQLLSAEVSAGTPLVQEQPAFAGPAAGIFAGATATATATATTPADGGEGHATPVGWTMLLAVDLTAPGPLLDWLVTQVSTLQHQNAVFPRDLTGRTQYLCAAVPSRWLEQRVSELTPAEVQDRSMRWLVKDLEGNGQFTQPLIPEDLSADVDTIQDARRWGLQLP